MTLGVMASTRRIRHEPSITLALMNDLSSKVLRLEICNTTSAFLDDYSIVTEHLMLMNSDVPRMEFQPEL